MPDRINRANPLAPPASSLVLEQLLRGTGAQGAPSTIGQGIFAGARGLTQGLLARELMQQEQADTAAQDQALLDLISGRPAETPTPAQLDPTQLTPGSQAGTLAAPATQGLLPNVPRGQAEAAISAGAGPALLERATEQLVPQQITPAEQARLDIQREGLDVQREGLQIRRDQYESDQAFNQAKLAIEEAKLAQEGAGAQQAKLSDISSFRSQYTGLSEDFIAIRDAYGKLRETAKDPSAAGDIALVSGFMKMIDPQSVVREGEFVTAADAAGVPERIRGLWNRLVAGERLTADQRTDFAQQAHALFQGQLQQQEQLQGAYRGIASRTLPNVDPGDAAPDFIGTSREWQPIVGQPTDVEETGTSLLERGREVVEGMLPDAGAATARSLGTNEPTGSADVAPTVNSQAEFDALPSGTLFRDSQGNLARKP